MSLKIESDGVGSEVRFKYSGMSSFGMLKSRSGHVRDVEKKEGAFACGDVMPMSRLVIVQS